jgi:hypothetical protein
MLEHRELSWIHLAPVDEARVKNACPRNGKVGLDCVKFRIGALRCSCIAAEHGALVKQPRLLQTVRVAQSCPPRSRLLATGTDGDATRQILNWAWS